MDEQISESRGNPPAVARSQESLAIALVGNALTRIAGGASGILVGLYLAGLANQGARVNVALVATLGAVSFAAELVLAVPMGMLSDAVAPRALLTAGAILGALAAQMVGMTGHTGVFFLSRSLEGLGAAAGAPPLLAHLTDATEGDPPLRSRVMGFFELSLLAGFALGGLLAAWLWKVFHTAAFSVVAVVYFLSAGFLFFGTAGSRGHGRSEALAGFGRALREPSLRRLAPVWLCVNSIVGLWLGPTQTFLLTQKTSKGQFLTGIFAEHPEHVGWMLFGYSLVFGVGVSVWSFVLPRVQLLTALRIALAAMFAVCLGLLLLNHSGSWDAGMRWTIGVATAVCIMIESGFTPAALLLLAGAIGARAGRGAAMGIYSMLLSLGAIVGSLIAAALGDRFAVDGLIYGTLAMATVAMALVGRLGRTQVANVNA